jgi:hypothetical protein
MSNFYSALNSECAILAKRAWVASLYACEVEGLASGGMRCDIVYFNAVCDISPVCFL